MNHPKEPSEGARLDFEFGSVEAGQGRNTADSLVCDAARQRLAPLWDSGRNPLLELDDAELGIGTDVNLLCVLAKEELCVRFARGERAEAFDYLSRFPLLRGNGERALSLIYEEFCLHEEAGQPPAVSEFVERYPNWADSLASQLRYHRMLSEVVGLPSPPRYPRPGEVFARRFRLRSLLGEGGAARVYLAEQPELGDRAVALKLSATNSAEPSIQGRLDHEHIVPVWSVVEDEESGLQGLCMPFRPGRPLDLVIRFIHSRPKRPTRAVDFVAALFTDNPPARRMSESPGWRGFRDGGTYCEAVAWFGSRMARALAHAHSKGICHRDVKPSNILLTYREGPQLLDFNLAQEPNSARRAEAALRGGTLPYMAPEQLRAFLDPEQHGDLGTRADLFSLGLVLDELLTGDRPPNQRVDTTSLPRLINEMLTLRMAPRRCVRMVNPAVPHGLAAIISKCLEADPERRYETADQLAADLDAFTASRPLRYTSNPSRAERVTNALKRSRWAIATACGLAVVACLLIVGARLAPRPSVPVTISAAIDLTNKMNAHLQQGDIAKARESHNRAVALYRDAVSRDRDAHQAWCGLAHHAYLFDANLAEALRLYDQAIEALERTAAPPAKRVNPLLCRALVRNRMGGVIQKGAGHASEASVVAARPHYLAALRDLDDVRELEETGQVKLNGDERFRLLHFSARTRLGLGDVLTGSGRQNNSEALGAYVLALADCRAARDAVAAMPSDPAVRGTPAMIEAALASISEVEKLLNAHAAEVRREIAEDESPQPACN